jgi:2-hydroxycyclohexanecarboxyl-CoA dehydrogenase
VDIASVDSVRALTFDVRRKVGTVYSLVNCAGWDDIKPFAETHPQPWERVILINLCGIIAMTHAFLNALIEGRGRIINISSDAGRVGS